MGNIQTVGPNEALIVSGGCCRPSRKQIITGGWCWSTWLLTNIQRISLQIMTLNPKCEHVQSCHGVPVTVTGVVHCKIMSSHDFLPFAAEQFLGKSIDHIRSVILQTVEGHMRAVIGTQTIEDICKKRQELASMIREATTKDLSRMGIDILSLTIKEIKDDVEYLSSAGKRSTAHVKRDAAVSAAKAECEAAQVEAKCIRDKKERALQKDTKLAELQHRLELAKATYNEEAGQLRAEATKAYDLKLAILHKGIKSMEMELKSCEYDNLIQVQRIENERRKMELEMEVQLPTKFEVYELTKRIEAHKARQEAETEAETFRIEMEGKARSHATEVEGKAEAEGMKRLAMVRATYNNAAKLFEVLKVLPEVAAEVASPLTKFEEIVLISDGTTTNNNKQTTNEQQDDSGAPSINKQTRLRLSSGAGAGYAAEAAKLTSALPLAVKAVGGNERMSSSLLSSLMQSRRNLQR